MRLRVQQERAPSHLFILDPQLAAVDGVRGLDIQAGSPTREGLYEDLSRQPIAEVRRNG